MAPVPEPFTDRAPARPGAITLARHGEPALSRRVRLNAQGYRRWWAAYEEGGILPDQAPPEGLAHAARHASTTFVSTRRRAQETAATVVAGPCERDPVFVEAPLPPPPLPGFVRLRPRTWGFVSRFTWWWFNLHAGEESQRQAARRAEAAAERLALAAAEGDVLLVAHGFFNLMIGLALQKRGWKLVQKTGFGYWSMRRYVRG